MPPTRSGVVFLVQDISQLGGSERQSLTLAKALVARGIPVRLLSLTDGVPPRRWLGDLFVEHRGGVRIYRLPRVVFEALASTLLARWSDWGTLFAVGTMLGAIAARLGRVHAAPVVVKLAGSGAWGDMAALQALAPRARSEVQVDLATTTLICLTAHMEQEVREAGFPPTCLRRIPNGVDLAAVAKARIVQSHETPTILYVGRLNLGKGVDVLVEAFSLLRADGTNAKLVIAGPGPERQRLEARAGALGIADAVEFLGVRRDASGLLKGATLCCQPSHSEGMSNVLLEALAAGTPIVASAIPPNRELLESSKSGTLVAPNDPGALAKALAQVLEDATLRARLSAAAKKRAQDFDLNAVADTYAELFSSQQRASTPSRARWAARFVQARGAQLRRLVQ